MPEFKIFTNPPRQEGDDRQGTFGAALDQIHGQEEYQSGGTINMIGFPASSVDLGWLQGRARDYWQQNDVPYEEFRKLAITEIYHVIQRPKMVKMTPEKWEEGTTHMTVDLKTKDDHGWYVYEFSVYLKKEKRVLKVVD